MNFYWKYFLVPLPKSNIVANDSWINSYKKYLHVDID